MHAAAVLRAVRHATEQVGGPAHAFGVALAEAIEREAAPCALVAPPVCGECDDAGCAACAKTSERVGMPCRPSERGERSGPMLAGSPSSQQLVPSQAIRSVSSGCSEPATREIETRREPAGVTAGAYSDALRRDYAAPRGRAVDDVGGGAQGDAQEHAALFDLDDAASPPAASREASGVAPAEHGALHCGTSRRGLRAHNPETESSTLSPATSHAATGGNEKGVAPARTHGALSDEPVMVEREAR